MEGIDWRARDRTINQRDTLAQRVTICDHTCDRVARYFLDRGKFAMITTGKPCMPFKPGQKPPPRPSDTVGRGAQRARYAKVLAMAVRDECPVTVLVEYHIAIACGHRGVRLMRDEDGELSVTWDNEHESMRPEPTQDEITKSVNWLSDHGHGLPAQSIQVEATVRQHHSGALTGVIGSMGALSAEKVAALRALLADVPKALPAPVTLGQVASAIDVPETGSEVPESGTGDE